MNLSKPGLLVAALVLLTSCSRLPTPLRRDIAYQNDRLHDAERQLQRAQDTLASDLSQSPDLFQNASAPAEWKTRLHSDRAKLDSSERIQAELNELARRGHADSEFHAEHLLAQERQLLQTAETDSQAVDTAVGNWVDFGRDLPARLGKMQREYAAICNFDLAPVAKDVGKAEHDWPAKKNALDERLDALRDIPKRAETEWKSTAAVREAASNAKPNGSQLATLLQADEDLAHDESALVSKAAELQSLSGQLYYSWDKILTDLDDSRYGGDELFRERIKTVRTHLIDVASKKTETTSDEHWTNVTEPQFRAVRDDVGMAIAHKDLGLFDSEAQNTPQPAGFAYIAPESVGSNQYGYWDHSSGHSVWAWLPEYLILRELLWNHDYRPVIADEYRAYRTAQTAGRTFYGQTTPAAPPTYGTHGTFTQQHYADSRYVQRGGFSSSGYASRPGGFASAPRGSAPAMNDTAGHRFGSGAHPPSGQRFGRLPSAGRRFGGRR